MKTPICSFDAKTGILCSKCESKLKSGHLTEGDVEASIKLMKLAEKNNIIDKFTLTGAFKLDEGLIMVLPSQDISIIRSDENIMNKIKEEFKENIWIIETGATEKRFIENLVYPVKIDSINLVWLPDGNKLTKIVISEKKNKNKIVEEVKIKGIASKIKNIELLIEYVKK
ncbi:MAG: transcription elongation factor NusA [Nitrososphaerales archaeon]